MWKHVSSSFQAVYQYVNLVFGSNLHHCSPPTKETVKRAKELFEILRVRHEDPDKELELIRVQELLHECADIESLLNVTNRDGYNCLQASVILHFPEYLDLFINAGVNLNRGKCSLPLHLACRLGNKSMVLKLVNKGADINIECGMCYPLHHTPIRHVPSRFHFLETDIFHCDTDHQLPVMYAIEGGHIEIVQFLLSGVSGPDHNWPAHRLPLHHACRHGAYESMEFLANMRPDSIHDVDDEGYTPLLFAVQWGKKFVMFLEEQGADVFSMTKKENTLLHELFENVQDPSTLFETASHIMALGLEQKILHINTTGNTCLMGLIALVNRKISSFPNKPTLPQVTQEEFDGYVLQVIELLLRHNCDPNYYNASGVNALHKLILTFDGVASSSMSLRSSNHFPQKEKYVANVGLLKKAMELLLNYKANSNLVSMAGRSPLDMMFNVVQNMDHGKIEQCHDGLISCFQLLCQFKAHPSRSVQHHKSTVANLTRLGVKCLMERQSSAQAVISQLLKDLLTLLFQNGLNQNFSTLLSKPQPEGASGNILSELVKLSHRLRYPGQVQYIYDWVKLALQWGSNPDLEPHPSDPIICHSQGSMFFKPKGSQPVTQLMYELQDSQEILEAGGAHKLLMLFYNTMDHNVLFQSLKNAKEMSRFDANRSPRREFIQMVNELSSQPRSLHTCAKVQVYKAINRQIMARLPRTPLPQGLQKQLIRID